VRIPYLASREITNFENDNVGPEAGVDREGSESHSLMDEGEGQDPGGEEVDDDGSDSSSSHSSENGGIDEVWPPPEDEAEGEAGSGNSGLPAAGSEDAQEFNRLGGLPSYHELHEQEQRRVWEETCFGSWAPNGEAGSSDPTARSSTDGVPPAPASGDGARDSLDLLTTSSECSDEVDGGGEVDEMEDLFGVETPEEEGEEEEVQAEQARQDDPPEDAIRVNTIKWYRLGFIESSRSRCVHIVSEESTVGAVRADNGKRYVVWCRNGTLKSGKFIAAGSLPVLEGDQWACPGCARLQ